MEERLLNLPAVQLRIPVGRDTLYRLINSGELRSVTVGRRRLIPESALQEYLSRIQADPVGNRVANDQSA